MTNEIILTPYQSTVFNATEALLRTQGYLGEALFEDTYVLSKKLAQYIVTSVPANGTVVSSYPTKAYNAVLGISTTTASAGSGTPAAAADLNDLAEEFAGDPPILGELAQGPLLATIDDGRPPANGGSGTAG